ATLLGEPDDVEDGIDPVGGAPAAGAFDSVSQVSLIGAAATASSGLDSVSQIALIEAAATASSGLDSVSQIALIEAAATASSGLLTLLELALIVASLAPVLGAFEPGGEIALVVKRPAAEPKPPSATESVTALAVVIRPP
ncbi:MAG TPA: hypothetical protein VFA06_17725, partial [Actinocrinis sp.]|uniref:hypothetical protein n=1 Tax=Actinocrinis sp. TaxID=1920516 RepID=UPI002D385C59